MNAASLLELALGQPGSVPKPLEEPTHRLHPELGDLVVFAVAPRHEGKVVDGTYLAITSHRVALEQVCQGAWG